MFDALFLTALGLFVLAVAMNIGNMARPMMTVKSVAKIICCLWVIMLVGMTLWMPHVEGVQNFGFLSSTYTLQISAVLIIAAFTISVIAQSHLPVGTWRNGVGLMAAYGVYAMLTAFVSPVPLLTLWKGWLVVLDAMLVAITVAHMGEKGRELLFNIVIGFLQLLVALVIASAIIWPDEALKPVGGLIGVHLYGVVPYLNPNEIGFMCAITAVVALRRIPDAVTVRMKFLYLSMLGTSLVVLFLSQARTSVIAFLLAMVFLGFAIRKLRVLVVIGVLALGGIGSYGIITGSSLGVGEVATTYMERGLSQDKIESMSGRTYLWEHGFEIFKQSPFFGHGFEAGVRFGEIGSHMHNAHMQTLVNTGLFGYLLWVSFVGAVGVQLLMLRKKRGFKNNAREGRFHFEIMAVYGVMLLRTITGSVLVFHQYSLVILMAIQVYLFAARRQLKPSAIGQETIQNDPIVPGKQRVLKKAALHSRLN